MASPLPRRLPHNRRPQLRGRLLTTPPGIDLPRTTRKRRVRNILRREPFGPDNLVPPLHEPDDWPGDQPQLQDDARPVHERVVPEGVDPVRRVERHEAVCDRWGYADMALVACRADMRCQSRAHRGCIEPVQFAAIRKPKGK